MKTTWRKKISKELEHNSESWSDIEMSTLTDSDLDIQFREGGYGEEDSIPFTAWTHTRVYFPVRYDGEEWVSSVPRNPCNQATEHIGVLKREEW